MVNTAGSGSSSTAMEEANKHWMWMRRKTVINNDEKPCVRSIIGGDSWEEQAFAEDTAGPFGGFMWPQRSYSCSFCGREFRSAQALGGHMNVHRRDRARLKQQSQTPQDDDANYPSILDVIHHEYPSRVLYNSKLTAGSTFVASSSPSRVSSVLVPISTAQENCSTTTDDSCEEQEKGSLLSLKLTSTTTTTTSTTTTSSSDSSKLEIGEKNSSSKAAYEDETAGGLVLVQNTEEIVKFDSAVSLNLAMLRPYRPTVSDSSSDDQEVVHIGYKRQRLQHTDHVTLSLALSVESTHDVLDKRDHFQKFPSSMEELDLELRLGNAT